MRTAVRQRTTGTHKSKPDEIVIRLEPLEPNHPPSRVCPHQRDDDGETQEDESFARVAPLEQCPFGFIMPVPPSRCRPSY